MRGRWVVLVGVAALAACGKSSVGAGDGGTDLGVVLTGTRLLAGDMDVKGVTRDGFVAVLDQARGALAVPLAGGAPQGIDPEAEIVLGRSGGIVSFRNWDEVAGIGDLTVWTPAAGAHAISTASTELFVFNDDATRFLATVGSSSDGTTTTLVVGGLDGAAPVTAFLASRDGPCLTRAAYSAGRFVVSHCDPGSHVVTISSVDPMTGASIPLLEDTKNQLTLLPGAAGLVAVVATNGDASLVPVAGGATTLLGHGVDALVPTPDGAAVLVRAQGVISRVDTAGRATVLVASGAASIWAESQDGRSMLFRRNFGPRSGYGDLFLTSALEPAPAVTLSTASSATTFGDAFTVDGSRVLYVTDADDLFVGTLTSRAVDGDAAPVVHGQRVWTTRAYADARVAFTSDYVPVPERPGRAVLRVVDTAAADAAPAVIATFAGADFTLAPARDRVIFTFDDGTSSAGLYVAPLPGALPVSQDASVSDAPDGAPLSDAGVADATSSDMSATPSDATSDVDSLDDSGADSIDDVGADSGADSLDASSIDTLDMDVNVDVNVADR